MSYCSLNPASLQISKKASIVYAFTASLPVLVGYLVMGIAWGIIAHGYGFSLFKVLFTSVLVFSGSLQFLMISMLQAGASAVEVIFASILLNSRYSFYIIGAKDQFDRMSLAQRLISYFTINDESFALISARKYPSSVAFYVMLFCYLYWVFGCLIGKLLGSTLSGDFTSLSFSSKALFIVLAYELARKCKSRFVLALAFCSCAASWIFVPEKYMLLAAVLASLVILLLAKEIKLV